MSFSQIDNTDDNSVDLHILKNGHSGSSGGVCFSGVDILSMLITSDIEIQSIDCY